MGWRCQRHSNHARYYQRQGRLYCPEVLQPNYPFQNVLPNDYERDDDDKKDDKKTRKLRKGHSTHARSFLRKADDSAHREYDLPIPSQKVIPDDYERNDNNNEKDDKVEWGDISV